MSFLLQVTSYWLPLIKQCSASDSKPVVLAGNKASNLVFASKHNHLHNALASFLQADLPYDSEAQSTRLQEILNTCLEVETGLEVCCKVQAIIIVSVIINSAQLRSSIMCQSCSILLRKQSYTQQLLSTLQTDKWVASEHSTTRFFVFFFPAQARLCGSTHKGV